MEDYGKGSIKVSIKYTEDAQCWNKLSNFLISFMLESDVFRRYCEKNEGNNNE